ncbi:MAG: hypothetical protein QOJ02_3391 [Acidobacteriota bacterium]|jgi:hypothetical protein|nr:hypothetical protein [Acidobacteriota bacterium]
MKKLYSSLISVMLVLSICNIGQTEASAVSLQARRGGGGASLRFAPRFIRAANRKLRYTVKAKYPQATGVLDARLEKLNQAIKNLITGEVHGFTKDFHAPEERTFSAGSTFESGYSVVLATNDLVSIDFVIETYFEGAIHGNNNSLVFNYDLNLGRSLSLAELFKPNSNYLKVISDYSIKALRKQLTPDPDDDWIGKGASASEENYKNWNITRRGLMITFDPYQVASFAEGPHEVVVPYSVLKNVIDPAGPLAKIAR